MDNKVMKMESDFKKLETRISSLECGNEKTNKGFDWKAAVLSDKKEDPTPKHQIDVLASVIIDQDERQRRTKNVLIFGLPESTRDSLGEKIDEDENKVDELFRKIKVNTNLIIKTRRFNSKQNSKYPAPILVELSSEKDKISVLAAAKSLRDLSEYKNVYINPDLTESQRAIQKELIELRKSKNEDEKRNNQPFRWGIRGNQVRRFKLQPSQECVQQDYQGHRNHNQRNFAGRGSGFM